MKQGVGYQRRDAISHRMYNWSRSIKRFKKTGSFNYVKDGSGHQAGEAWGDKKNIDPKSPVRKYGKNSPSFDEGVYLSKKKRAMAEKMKEKVRSKYSDEE